MKLVSKLAGVDLQTHFKQPNPYTLLSKKGSIQKLLQCEINL